MEFACSPSTCVVPSLAAWQLGSWVWLQQALTGKAVRIMDGWMGASESAHVVFIIVFIIQPQPNSDIMILCLYLKELHLQV